MRGREVGALSGLRGRRQYLLDALVGLGLLGVLFILVRTGQSIAVPFDEPTAPSRVSTDPANLPYYAARSLLRMFVALILSVVFTFIYATWAARSRRAEKILIPLLDILQSVPVLGFLSVTVTGFIALFPGSALGPELASIFAVFTAMVWNMTFAFYHSLITQPEELDEAARMMRLTRWQRFWKLDVPGGMSPLIWNGMMSFAGAWFFLAASETISVLNRTYALPGIGSFVATALQDADTASIWLAIGVMVLMIVGVNFLFWQPCLAWAERFRFEEVTGGERTRSVILDALRRSSFPALLGRATIPARHRLDKMMRPLGRTGSGRRVSPRRERTMDWVYGSVLAAAVAWVMVLAARYISDTVGFAEVLRALGLGGITLARVMAVLVISTIIWVPVGLWIGSNPKVLRIAQPVVQVLASFPANFLYPLMAALFLATGLSLNIGGILLMALGSQWYILFNIIEATSEIPSDWNDLSRNLGMPWWQRWRRIAIPAVFPAYVTGAITAAGGAWNASIVAEVANFGDVHLVAVGLGSYITEATAVGDFPRIFIGVAIMSVYVVGVNRILWNPLYSLASKRYGM